MPSNIGDHHRVSDPPLRGLEQFVWRTGDEVGDGLIEQATSRYSRDLTTSLKTHRERFGRGAPLAHNASKRGQYCWNLGRIIWRCRCVAREQEARGETRYKTKIRCNPRYKMACCFTVT